MIDGVILTPLRVIPDERGAVLHMLKRTDHQFSEFGEIYFSQIVAGQRKPWRRHLRATSHLAVPVGHVRFVLFDDRPTSPTTGLISEVEIGETNYQLLTIPVGIWFGLQNLAASSSLIANCATSPHDPSQVDRQDFATTHIPYLWRD